MIRTLNQLKVKLRDIALEQGQVNSYYFGDIGIWSEFQGLTYPSCLVTLTDAVIDKSTVDLNLTLIISSRLDQANSNRDDTLSDTLQICEDLRAMLFNEPEFAAEVEELRVIPFEEAMGSDNNADVVAGWRMDFTVTMLSPLNACHVPKKQRNVILTEEGFEIFTEDGNAIGQE